MKVLKAMLAVSSLAMGWLLAQGAPEAASPGVTATGSKAPAAPAADSRDPMAIAAVIDREIEAKLAEAKIPASPLADDAEFLRRVTLDIIGRIPNPQRVAAFLDDKDPDKRRKRIDELLADSEYGEHFGTIWYHLLIVPDDDNRRLISEEFDTWLTAQFNKNRGWDKIVTDILTAKGDRDKHPETVYMLSHVEGAKAAEIKPNKVMSSVAERFLGMQLQCAECHNHPFQKWRQTDYWGMAAYFSKTEAEHANKKAVKNGAVPGVGEGVGPAKGPLMVTIPDSKGKTTEAKFLDGTKGAVAGKSPRAAFAAWCTSPKNKSFADAAVNRVWGHFFGRGIVHPVDDFRDDNPPSHPEALKALSAEFAASGFDLKHLVRCICNSRTYQRTSDPLPGNKSDDKLFSHIAVKMMSPEVLFDSLTVAVGEAVVGRGGRANQGMKIKGVGSPKSQFLKLFDTAEERDFSVDYSHGIPQVLRLMNGGIFNNGGATVANLVKAGGGPEKIINGLYLATLSRRPTAAELGRMMSYVSQESEPTKGYAGVMWVLLNSSEFILNH